MTFDPEIISLNYTTEVPSSAKKMIEETLEERIEWLLEEDISDDFQGDKNELIVMLNWSELEDPPKIKVSPIDVSLGIRKFGLSRMQSWETLLTVGKLA